MSKANQSSKNVIVPGQSAPASGDTRHLKVPGKIGRGHQPQSRTPVKQEFPTVPNAPVATPVVKNPPALATRESCAAEQKPLPHNLHRKITLIRTSPSEDAGRDLLYVPSNQISQGCRFRADQRELTQVHLALDGASPFESILAGDE